MPYPSKRKKHLSAISESGVEARKKQLREAGTASISSAESVEAFDGIWASVISRRPELSAGLECYLRYYKPDKLVSIACTCRCANCESSSSSCPQITDAQWTKMKADEKRAFVIFHGGPPNLKGKDLDAAGQDLILKGAYLSPSIPASPIEDATAAAVDNTPLAHASPSKDRSVPWSIASSLDGASAALSPQPGEALRWMDPSKRAAKMKKRLSKKATGASGAAQSGYLGMGTPEGLAAAAVPPPPGAPPAAVAYYTDGLTTEDLRIVDAQSHHEQGDSAE